MVEHGIRSFVRSLGSSRKTPNAKNWRKRQTLVPSNFNQNILNALTQSVCLPPYEAINSPFIYQSVQMALIWPKPCASLINKTHICTYVLQLKSFYKFVHWFHSSRKSFNRSRIVYYDCRVVLTRKYQKQPTYRPYSSSSTDSKLVSITNLGTVVIY